MMLADRTVECARLDRLLLDVRAGTSAVLVLHGDPGVGKTSLLEYAAHEALGFRVVRATGVKAEMELPYAGLHLICAPLLGRLRRLPLPQREAMRTAFGLTAGPTPDQLLVGLAAVSLLAAAAEESPLLCIVDDAQWLDRSSSQVLAFVARRLNAEPIALLFGESGAEKLGEMDGLPGLTLKGLSYSAARELLCSVIAGPLDEAVRERIIRETRGNPLALLELPRGMSTDELAGGFGVTTARELPDRIEGSFREQADSCPPEAKQLLLVAAAEPTGNPTLVWLAASELGIPAAAAEPLESSGLLSIGSRVVFRHPLLRSAIYGAASKAERRNVHRALASATDPAGDPDRHAWHLSCAADGPDDAVAEKLERSAARARDRGGLAAAAAFLEKAALLTLDRAKRAERALAAAGVKNEAGAPEAALRLLATAEIGPLDSSLRAHATRLRSQLSFALTRGNDAPELLLEAARQLEPCDPDMSRETYLEALAAAIIAGRLGRGLTTNNVANAARLGPPARRPPRAIDLLLDALAVRFTEGYVAAVDPLKQALEAFVDAVNSDEMVRWLWLAYRVARDLWNDEMWHLLTYRHVQLARDTGALRVLPLALTYRAGVEVHSGRFAAASGLIDEAHSVARAAGYQPVADSSLMLAAWRGQEREAHDLLGIASEDARNRGEGYTLAVASYCAAVLDNGLGRYDEARAAAEDASQLDELGVTGWALVELIEAAARSGKPGVAASALRRLSQRTRLTGTDWALGVEARSRALLSDGDDAEASYLEAIERLGRSRIKTHLARAHLVYGEWLRRQGRRTEARRPLCEAQEMFTAMGAEAFAERVRRELLATGQRARRRNVETRHELTAQEAGIARLARDGLSNPEIGTRLFLSPRTVEYHLHKVFGKLGITSRTELHLVIPGR